MTYERTTETQHAVQNSGTWTEEENAKLLRAIERHGTKNWTIIETEVGSRTKEQCRYHWNYYLNPNIKKGVWTQEEDESLKQGVEKFGTNWTLISKEIPGRTSKQCRMRYTGFLVSAEKIKPWTQEENKLLRKNREELGLKWNVIVTFFPGRSLNCVKNHYYSLQKKETRNPQGQHLFDTLNEGFNAQSTDTEQSGTDSPVTFGGFDDFDGFDRLSPSGGFNAQSTDTEQSGTDSPVTSGGFDRFPPSGGFNAQSTDTEQSDVDSTNGYNDVVGANEDFDRLPSSDEWLFLDDDDCGLGM